MRRLLPVAMLALLIPLQAEAGEKVDLTAYLGIVPQVMDQRTYNDPNGLLRTEHVLSVTEVEGGWETLSRTDWVGGLVNYRVEHVIPGDRVRVNSMFGIALPEPATWAQLLTRLPRTLATFKIRTRHPDLHQRVVFRSRIVGFEPLDTPAFSFPFVLRIDSEQKVRTESELPGIPSGRSSILVRDWYLAGVGRVATEWADVLTGVPNEWLVSAQVNDIVLPPEAP